MRFLQRLPVSATLFAVALLLLQTASLRAVEPVEGVGQLGQPALGITRDFSRWNSTVRLVYDPDDAPSTYADDTKLLGLLKEATTQWERISGIRFEMTGINRNAADDVDHVDFQDGLVRISWTNQLGATATGAARPDFGTYDPLLGYAPYDDGSIRLNNAGSSLPEWIMLATLVHEIGHLLGLGHSDNPDSVMYANPYNNLLKPRPDDIRALQTMYGPPTPAIEPDEALPEWLYTAPPAASAADTEFLYKPNGHTVTGNGAYFVVDSGPAITAIDDNVSDDGLVLLRLSAGVSQSDINVPTSVVVVDPSGYVYLRYALTMRCTAGYACVQVAPIGYGSALKSVPGNWKVTIENAGGTKSLLKLTLPVTTTKARNFPPRATLSVAPGGTASGVDFTLAATDPEGDLIQVVWYPPNVDVGAGRRNYLRSGGSVSRTLNFPAPGTYTFFVEVNDSSSRYPGTTAANSAGDGFQTLLRVTLTVSATSLDAMHVVSTGDAGASGTANALLTQVARVPTNRQHVTTSDRTASTADFKVGASSDAGTTTQTTFSGGESVVISGAVLPQAADVGRSADIFVVLRTTTASGDTWSYRNTSGRFVPWNVTIPTLQPAYSVSSLKSSQAFEVHTGRLIPAQQRIYIGYRVSGTGTLHYTGQAHNLTVN